MKVNVMVVNAKPQKFMVAQFSSKNGMTSNLQKHESQRYLRAN